jgi:AGZA family xanthine/uracil permease-like MFS transporter
MMSQQHTTQTSGQGLLERVFKLREHGTTARTEVIAGFTTFLTMVYIVFVNPQILGVAGMDTRRPKIAQCIALGLRDGRGGGDHHAGFSLDL